MWLLLIPILILVVLLFSLASLFAGVFWVLGSFWPWLLIGTGVWLFWHQDRGARSAERGARVGDVAYRMRDRRSRQSRESSPRSTMHDPRSPSTPRSPIPDPRSRPELPIDLQVKVEQIRRKVDVLLGFADRFPPFSQDLHLVRQTAIEYLPRTIDTYLAMPPESVDKPLATGGKTAKQELRAQLDLLDAKLDEIAQDLQRQDADKLLANRRFLEARFGDRDKN